jgi:hypothetical protein
LSSASKSSSIRCFESSLCVSLMILMRVSSSWKKTRIHFE